jgi:hypothetical protein
MPWPTSNGTEESLIEILAKALYVCEAWISAHTSLFQLPCRSITPHFFDSVSCTILTFHLSLFATRITNKNSLFSASVDWQLQYDVTHEHSPRLFPAFSCIVLFDTTTTNA